MTTLPARCLWCGAVLQGGATTHRPDCWVPQLAEHVGLPVEHFESEARRFAPIAACICRTCGHRAASHISGSCYECGREGCWS